MLKVGPELRFAYWHSLRWMLYSIQGWNMYTKSLFGVSELQADAMYDASWTWRNRIYNDNIGNTPFINPVTHTDTASEAGTMELLDKDNNVLALITMSFFGMYNMDDRFDVHDTSLQDGYNGYNPEVLEFQTSSPHMHTIVGSSGTCCKFRFVSPNTGAPGREPLIQVLSGSVGVVGSGCDIIMKDNYLIQGKILKFTKFQLEI